VSADKPRGDSFWRHRERVIPEPERDILIQEEMIARVRQLCASDPAVVAAWMYGSFAKGEGDAHSDIEFGAYLDDATYDAFEPLPWLSQIAPVAVYFVNEFGTGTAIFENLVRGEFHFERAGDMVKVRELRKLSGFPPAEAMLIHDRTGELTAHLQYISGPGPERTTPDHLAWLWHSYLNWVLFGANVLARGERARALEILGFVHRTLLWFARLAEGKTEHWPTPSKNVEHELSQPAYDRFRTCTASLRGRELEQGYQAAWTWGKELARALASEHGFDTQEGLVRRLDARFTAAFKGEQAP
jgi:lincosamide nucleotidyltransferase